MADEPNGHPRPATTREQLGTVGQTVDEAFALLRELQSEFRRFVDAVSGVPGISKGALREIREQQDSLEERFDALEKGLPATIANAVGSMSNAGFRQRMSRWGMAGVAFIAAVSGGAVGALIQLFGHH